jgi:hypothetical protein
MSIMTNVPSKSNQELHAEAEDALESARSMPAGQARAEAMKRAGLLRKAVDDRGLISARRGRPPKIRPNI